MYGIIFIDIKLIINLNQNNNRQENYMALHTQ